VIYDSCPCVSIRAGLYTSDPDYDFQELCNEADHRLFNMILYSLNIMYWNNCCHPFSHKATTLENGRILDRFQTAVLI